MSAMTKQLFWKQVEKHLRRATDKERYAIRAELEGHIEDHALALEEAGYPAGEAVERAVAAMGEPEEIGKALNAQFSIFWRGMIWTASILIVVLVFQIFSAFYALCWQPFQENHRARTDPWKTYYVDRYQKEYTQDQDLDIRVQIGDDELFVFWVGIDPGVNEAMVAMCIYDQKAYGQISRNLDGVWVENQAGERGTGGGGGSSAFASNRRVIVPVAPGDTHVTLRYDRFGEKLAIKVPLPWEVSQ